MIYFITTQDNRYVKIGTARDVQKRLASLQTGMPETLRLLAAHAGSYAAERTIHTRFTANRARGEWYHLTDEIIAFALAGSDLESIGNSPAFAQYCRVEPRLVDLAARVSRVKDDPSDEWFCANEVWYGYNRYRGQSLKRAMLELVGETAYMAAPQLRTEQAYDCVYDTLYAMLPNCRACGCV